MTFFHFTLRKLLYENPERTHLLNSLLPGTLYLEDVEDLSTLWDKITVAVDRFVSQVNDALAKRNISPQQKSVLFSNVLSRIMQQSGTALDIPGIGKVSRLGGDIGKRSYRPDAAPAVQQDYKERIRNRYLELLKSGMDDMTARETLRQQWRGLEDNKLLSTILRGLKPATAASVRPEKLDIDLVYQQIQENFRKLIQGKKTEAELTNAARTLYPQFQQQFPTNNKVRLMIWHMLEQEAQALGIELTTTYNKFARTLQAGATLPPAQGPPP